MVEFYIPNHSTVREIHDIVVELHGGLTGVPRPENIDIAIHRPEFHMMYDRYCDVHLVAALVLDSLARDHAFADGNKRTALLTMLFLYNLNSVHLALTHYSNRRLERLVLDVAEKEPDIKVLRRRLKRIIHDLTPIAPVI